jgi:F-type H+-transporting ATPase subunit epsilon
MRLEVVTPSRRLLDEEVDEIQLPGSLGALGILPGHAPLLSGLGIGELSFRQGSTSKRMAIKWGFVEVSSDYVKVLADLAEWPDEIDVVSARQDALEAEAALANAEPDEVDELRDKLAYAYTRQMVVDDQP